jgi:hypothetical protein
MTGAGEESRFGGRAGQARRYVRRIQNQDGGKGARAASGTTALSSVLTRGSREPVANPASHRGGARVHRRDPRYHAANYESIAGVDIRADPAVLCNLCQGGASEARAARLARRRARDPGAKPVPGDEMGPWVETHRAFIRGLLAAPDPIVSAGAGPDDPVESPRPRAASPVVGDQMVVPYENVGN